MYIHISFVKFNCVLNAKQAAIWNTVFRVYKHAIRFFTQSENERLRHTQATTVQCSPDDFCRRHRGGISISQYSRSISCFGDSIVAGKDRRRERKREGEKKKSACALQDTVNLHRATSVRISLRIDFCKEVISTYIYIYIYIYIISR